MNIKHQSHLLCHSLRKREQVCLTDHNMGFMYSMTCLKVGIFAYKPDDQHK